MVREGSDIDIPGYRLHRIGTPGRNLAGIISRCGRAIQLLQDFRIGRGIDRGAKLGGYFSNGQY
jgi:hypothetical protein